MSSTTKVQALDAESPNVVWTPLHEISEPGTYACRDTGHLIRVTPAGAAAADSAMLEQHRENPIHVTRISSDPFLSLTRARIAAANLDIEVSA